MWRWPPGAGFPRWGDCKDKTLLLIDLLEAVGIEAQPALALLGSDRRVERDFPSPFQFNHLVAAIKVDGLGSLPETAPIVGDWPIIDGTQRRDGGAWLNPSVQGPQLLLVGPSGGELLEAPVTPSAGAARETLSRECEGEPGRGIGPVRVGARRFAVRVATPRELDLKRFGTFYHSIVETKKGILRGSTRDAESRDPMREEPGEKVSVFRSHRRVSGDLGEFLCSPCRKILAGADFLELTSSGLLAG